MSSLPAIFDRFMKTFVNTYTFILETYIAPLQTLLLRGAPSPVTAKGEGLEGDVKFGRGGHQQGTQLNREIIPGRWAHH